jgi:pimeloyl-ACP methyl ester carboxylesterase
MLGAHSLKAQDAASITKDFLNKVDKEDYEGARSYLDEKIKGKLHPVALHDFWQNLQAQAGMLKSLGLPQIKDTLGGKRVIYTATFSKRPVYITFQFNAQNKIVGMDAKEAPITKVLAKKEAAADSAKIEAGNDNTNLPEYAHPEQYVEQHVEFKSGGYTLPGIITLPKNGSKWPIALLIQNHGPLDKDGTMGPNKPMRDIAIGLAQNGVASFRWDKRGYVYKEQLGAQATELSANQEVIEDAIAAIYYVRSLDFIDRTMVYIVGHAMGAFLTPLIAQHAPYLAGIVMMNSNAFPYDISLHNKQKFLGIKKNDPDSAENLIALDQKLRGVMHDSFPAGTLADQLPGGLSLAYWKEIKNYSPAYTAASLKMPVFVMQGTRDYEVNIEDLDRWSIAMRKKTNKKIKSYPVNHMLQEGKTDIGLDDEYMQPRHVPYYFIQEISDWVKKKS